MEKLKSGSEVTESEGDWLSNDLNGNSDASTQQLGKGGVGPAQTTYLYIQMEYCPRCFFLKPLQRPMFIVILGAYECLWLKTMPIQY